MRATLFFLLATLLFSASAVADDSLEAICKALERTESAVKEVRCSYLSLLEQRRVFGGKEKRTKKRGIVRWSISESGEGSVEAEIEYTIMSGKTWSENTTIAFDNETQSVTTVIGGVEMGKNVLLGRDKLRLDTITPLDMTVHYNDQPVSVYVRAHCSILGTEKWEGRVVDAVGVVDERGARKTVLWVDVERGITVRKTSSYLTAQGKVIDAEEHVGSEYREIDGIWLPMKFRRVIRSGETTEKYLETKEDISVTEWAVTEK